MPAKMQLLIRCNGRIFLAICLILFVGYTAQVVRLHTVTQLRCYRVCNSSHVITTTVYFLGEAGKETSCAPMQKARYKRVRCRPDSWAANCIEETGPWFYMPNGGANRILPPMADPSLMKRYQELGDIFPLSDEESGSGSDAAVEAEPASGSGLGNGDSLSEAKLPIFPEGLRGRELKQKLTEEDLLL